MILVDDLRFLSSHINLKVSLLLIHSSTSFKFSLEILINSLVPPIDSTQLRASKPSSTQIMDGVLIIPPSKILLISFFLLANLNNLGIWPGWNMSF